ncbi:MAG: HDIG domain-containing protein [Bacteroidales bacterium]|nr:HDIG domain-containing protein [Bacteroidales bacterium]
MSNRSIGKFSRIVLPFLTAVILLTILMPRTGKFDYVYHKGGKWNYETLVAPFNFPILKTQEQIMIEKEELENTYVPYFSFSNDLFYTLEREIKAQFAEDENVAAWLISSLKPCYQKGVLPDEYASVSDFTDVSGDVVFVQKDKRALKVLKADLYSVSSLTVRMQEQLSAHMPLYNQDSLKFASRLGQILVPNLVFDKKTTELIHQESSEFISPTSGVFKAGDIIVDSGEIVTADIAQILDSYRAEFEQTVGYNGPTYMLIVGNFAIAVMLALLLFAVLGIMYGSSWQSKGNELLFILFVYILTCIVTFICVKLPGELTYLMPFPVFALYYLAFLKKRQVLPLYMITILPVMIFCENGMVTYFIFFAGGCAAVYAFGHFNKGWRQFVTAIFIFASSLFVYMSFKIFQGSYNMIEPMRILYLGIGSIVGILCYQLVYLLEILFNLISVSRLVDIADTNAPLLRLLADKAPGTFQHSLSVMNMAEAAGRRVDANVPLLRAAALYHDIGKTENPSFFVENQINGIDSHENLPPKEGARIIIDHVSAGVALAEKFNIPSIIRDCIASHHGTTATGYFLTKYLNDGGDKDDIADFHYSGPKPKTKEQVILMLCDGVEAASRTLKDFSPETVDAFVHDLYIQKYKDGQFSDADVSMREIKEIEDAVKTYLVNMHHSRIVYPKRNKLI